MRSSLQVPGVSWISFKPILELESYASMAKSIVALVEDLISIPIPITSALGVPNTLRWLLRAPALGCTYPHTDMHAHTYLKHHSHRTVITPLCKAVSI